MLNDLQVSLFDLVACLSRAMDLVSPAVSNHHLRVAYIAFSLGRELGMSLDEQRDLALAGSLHDSGALSLKERLDALEFELASPQTHAETGYKLLMTFRPLARVARIVRYHHVPWKDASGPTATTFAEDDVPLASHVLHLADRVAVLIQENDEILSQARRISELVRTRSGTMFAPDLVNAFLGLATKEFFWFDVALLPPSEMMSLLARAGTGTPASAEPAEFRLDLEGLLGLADLFRRIIDFRSPFTAAHSAGVAATAARLACLAGFSEMECRMMRAAGYLHDIGKLAVPAEILEKPGPLTEHEFNIIKQHAFHSYRIIELLPMLDVVNRWASLHHERLDGRGYPFHYSGRELSLGSRIMSVADVFTALTEQRPYRHAMEAAKALDVVRELGCASALDPEIVSLLASHLDEVDADRRAAQAAASQDYQASTGKGLA
ncbi:MAG: HD domain-containing protein [Firmicutes bacterium]|nr:HD domain-containing protein [Bacillota bacterium]